MLGTTNLYLAAQRQRRPGALVPALRSLQSAPGAKFIFSALPRATGSPSTHSSVPSAEVTATTTPESTASSTNSRRMIGSAGASGWVSRRFTRLSALIAVLDGRAAPTSGSTPLARLRCQLSATTGRTELDSSADASTSPVTNRSWTSRNA